MQELRLVVNENSDVGGQMASLLTWPPGCLPALTTLTLQPLQV